MTRENFDILYDNIHELMEKMSHLEKAGFVNTGFFNPVFAILDVTCDSLLYKNALNDIVSFISIGYFQYERPNEQMRCIDRDQFYQAIMMGKRYEETQGVYQVNIQEIIGDYKKDLEDDAS